MKHLLFLLLIITALTTQAQIVGGIGAQLKLDTAKDGSTLPRITGIVPYSPADAKNIPKDSYILQVDGFDCRNKNLEDVVKNIRGEVGTPVKLLLADNMQGKKAKEYNLIRGSIVVPATAPAPPPVDPTTAFYDWCGQQTAQIRKQHPIIKKFTSVCGNFFFSFESEEGLCHARMMLLEEKGASIETSASFYDNSDETGAVALKQTGSHDEGNNTIKEMEGTITMKRNSVGVIKVNAPTDAKCKGMFIVVYK